MYLNFALACFIRIKNSWVYLLTVHWPTLQYKYFNPSIFSEYFRISMICVLLICKYISFARLFLISTCGVNLAYNWTIWYNKYHSWLFSRPWYSFLLCNIDSIKASPTVTIECLINLFSIKWQKKTHIVH